MNGPRFETLSKHGSYESAPGWAAIAVVVALALISGSLPAFAEEADQIDFIMPPADAELTDSGILSQVVTAGTGQRPPDPEDQVLIHFVGWSPEGGKMYSSYDMGKPVLFKMRSIFPGWHEAVTSMVKGEKRRIWLPGHLVAKGRGPKGASIFELELLGIKRTRMPPANLERPESAERTPSGAYTEALRPGTGTEHPAADSLALMNYIGWTADGQTFDSTADRGRATALPLADVMPAFAEAVQLMVVGEVRRLWIPGPVAAGNWVGSPKGALIFEVELLKILPPETLQKKPVAPPKPGGGGAS